MGGLLCSAYALDALDQVQKKCQKLFPSARLDSLEHRRRVADVSVFHQIMNHIAPKLVSSLAPPPLARNRTTRQSESMHALAVQVPKQSTEQFAKSFVPRLSRLWNALPANIAEIECNGSFKRQSHKSMAAKPLRL